MYQFLKKGKSGCAHISAAGHKNAMNKITLKIDGMACSMCEAHINDVIRKVVPDAKKVESSHTKGESTFLTDTAVDFAWLKKNIHDTGYTLVSFDSQPYVKKGFFGFGK